MSEVTTVNLPQIVSAVSDKVHSSVAHAPANHSGYDLGNLQWTKIDKLTCLKRPATIRDAGSTQTNGAECVRINGSRDEYISSDRKLAIGGSETRYVDVAQTEDITGPVQINIRTTYYREVTGAGTEIYTGNYSMTENDTDNKDSPTSMTLEQAAFTARIAEALIRGFSFELTGIRLTVVPLELAVFALNANAIGIRAEAVGLDGAAEGFEPKVCAFKMGNS